MPLNLSLQNSLSNISFCDKQCSNLNNNKAKEELISYIQDTYKLQIINRSYVTLSPQMLRNVSFHQHILSTLTNGNIYLLLLTKVDDINCCFFIDRKLKNGYSFPKIHCVKYRFADELFEKETIFQGELIRDQNRDWFFIINDILFYKGESTKSKNVLSRFELLHNIFEKEYVRDEELEICPLQIKKLFLYQDIDSLINDFIPNLSYVCKGLVFYTLSSNYSDYAYIMPRDKQIRIKSSNEIDSMIKEKKPELFSCQMMSLENTNDITTNVINSDEKNKYNNVVLVKDNETNDDNSNEKKIEKNNIVCKVVKTDVPDIYYLYALDGDNLYKLGNALIPNIKISLMMFELFNKNDSNKVDYNMECTYSKYFNKWVPIRIVKNKSYQKGTINQIEKRINEN
jgi:hypothetical protein